jgi:hypothetical protein
MKFSLRPSAYLCALCVEIVLNAESAEIRRGPQRRESEDLLARGQDLVRIEMAFRANEGAP